jgi:GAF domain-containing protein/DNA-binding CsgD family transcriptional regulator
VPTRRSLSVEEAVWRKLSDAALALHSELALEVVLETLAQHASTLTATSHAAVGVLDRAGGGFERVLGDIDVLHRAAESDANGALSAPVVIRGAPYATVAVAERRDGSAFTSDDEAVLVVLAEHAAVAIENARLYESATRWLAQLEALGEIGNTLASEHDLSRLLAGVCKQLRELLDARTLFVALPTVDGDLEVRAVDGEASAALFGFRLPLRGSKTGRVFERGRSERVDSLIDDVEVNQTPSRLMSARAGLFVPLLAGEEAIGMIVAINKQGSDTFSEADLHLAENFAARVAVAVRLATAGEGGAVSVGVDGAVEADSAGLTAREVEVLRLVAYGMSDALIAERLVVSLRTVHSHLRSIYRKLGVGSRSAATRWAVEHHLA